MIRAELRLAKSQRFLEAVAEPHRAGRHPDTRRPGYPLMSTCRGGRLRASSVDMREVLLVERDGLVGSAGHSIRHGQIVHGRERIRGRRAPASPCELQALPRKAGSPPRFDRQACTHTARLFMLLSVSGWSRPSLAVQYLSSRSWSGIASAARPPIRYATARLFIDVERIGMVRRPALQCGASGLARAAGSHRPVCPGTGRSSPACRGWRPRQWAGRRNLAAIAGSAASRASWSLTS